MSDRRSTPANGRVAAARLKGLVQAERFTEGEPRRIAAPLTDLRREPSGARERQLLLGEAVTVYETRAGWAFVEAARDGYVGYAAAADLAAPADPTYRLAARSGHAYAAPDIKAPERHALSFGARLTVTATLGAFAETDAGDFVPLAQLAPIDSTEPDPVAVAERLLGTPYLWGGNSAFGIDCSGLVQAGCLAAGIACPGDSDQQAAALGRPLEATADLRRGDLLFWRGHVAWVAGPDRLIHANAHHMAVAFEPLQAACERIAASEGAITARRRL